MSEPRKPEPLQPEEVPVSPADRALLAELGRISAQADPVPPHVLAAARAAYALRDLDAELAQLVEDSSLAGVRSGGTATRLLTFEAGDTELEVQVSYASGRATLLGQLVPAGEPGAQVRLATSAGGEGTAVEVDDLGGFRFDDLAPGLVRVRVDRPGVGGVRTAWFEI
jgi:hypothetical protein